MTFRFKVPREKVPDLGGRTFLKVGDKFLVLFNINQQFYAIDDSCPHQGASMYSGCLEGRIIACPAHGLRFDLASGFMLNSIQFKIPFYAVETIEEQLFIVLEQEE